MGYHIFTVNQKITQVNDNGIIQHVKKHGIYNTLKSTRHITKTKCYDIKFGMSHNNY